MKTVDRIVEVKLERPDASSLTISLRRIIDSDGDYCFVVDTTAPLTPSERVRAVARAKNGDCRLIREKK